MKKSELTNGMIVETKNNQFIVLLGYECGYFKGKRDVLVATDGSKCWEKLDCYREDLIHQYDSDTIIRVYKPKHPYCTFDRDYDKTLIWDRNLKEYTMAELTKIVGHEFKLIK